MTKWQMVEKFMDDNPGQQFTNQDVARYWDQTPAWGSQAIQAYLAAQQGPRFRGGWVIHRTGRTRNAAWNPGVRSSDVRKLARQTKDDWRNRIERAVEPTLVQMGIKNPRAVPVINASIKGVEAAVEMLEALLVEG